MSRLWRDVLLSALASIALAPFPSAASPGKPIPLKHGHGHVRTGFAECPGPSPCGNGPLTYHGGVIQYAPHVYLTFWGFGVTPNADPAGETSLLQNLFSGIGGSSWGQTLTLYCQGLSSGATTQGCTGQYTPGNYVNNLIGVMRLPTDVWLDNNDVLPPASTISDIDVMNEADRAAYHFGDDSVNAQYWVMTPNGYQANLTAHHTCALHSYWLHASTFALTYVDLPYLVTSGAGCGQNYVPDLYQVSYAAVHEYAEVATDPYGDAWYDAAGEEIGDKCGEYNFDTGVGNQQLVTLNTQAAPVYVQPLYSDATNWCALSRAGPTVAAWASNGQQAGTGQPPTHGPDNSARSRL